MFHVKHEGWVEAAESIGTPLPEGAATLLSTYERLLVERGGPMGVVASRDLERIRERHILDCLRAATLIGPEALTGYDLGSGGGLPGIVLAIACPHLSITLVEVRRNRAAFLTEVVAELGVDNVDVYARRLETLRERRGLCLARAFAPLPKAWRAAAPLLTPKGRLIYWAGASFDRAADVPEGVSTRMHPPTGLPGAGSLVESWISPSD
jgi:16S rRNA (guanine527-N7)-methyltransferase